MNHYYGGERVKILIGKYKDKYGKIIRWSANPPGYIVQVADTEIFLFGHEID